MSDAVLLLKTHRSATQRLAQLKNTKCPLGGDKNNVLKGFLKTAVCVSLKPSFISASLSGIYPLSAGAHLPGWPSSFMDFRCAHLGKALLGKRSGTGLATESEHVRLKYLCNVFSESCFNLN